MIVKRIEKNNNTGRELYEKLLKISGCLISEAIITGKSSKFI